MNRNKKKNNKIVNGSFLYLMPEEINAMQLHDTLNFFGEKQLEVWTEINLLEITTDEGTITFEDMMGNLRKEDYSTLERIGMKKVYAVDYSLTEKTPLYKTIETLNTEYNGKPGADTDDFKPFFSLKEL